MTSRESREFARVPKRLPVRVRIVDVPEARELTAELLEEASIRPGILTDTRLPSDLEVTWERRALATLLERVEELTREVEHIASCVDTGEDTASDWIAGETASISGSGLAIFLPVNLETDTLVEIEIRLRDDLGARLRALGRIASLVPPDGDQYPVGRFHLGLAFETLHEQDQQALVRYSFKEQRRTLRRRHAAEQQGDPVKS